MSVVALLLLLSLVSPPVAAGEAGDLQFYSPPNLLRFAASLEAEGDFIRAAQELERALALLGAEAVAGPGLYRRIADAYRHGGDLQRALRAYQRWATLAASAEDRIAASARIGYTYHLMARYPESIDVLAAEGCTLVTPLAGGEELALVLCLDLLAERRWQEAAVVAAGESEESRSLRSLAVRGVEAPRRSAAVAALMSTVVPGLGKVYAGTAGDGLYSFLSIGTLVTLSVLSFRAEGVRSVEGWVTAGLAAVLHAGNIWGSAQAARRYNDRVDSTILHDVTALAADLF